jgi:predicted acyl esterase
MSKHRAALRGLLVLALAITVATPVRAALVSGTVTDAVTGDPLPDTTVGFTRVDVLDGLPAGDPIPVEASVTTDSHGFYSMEIASTIPGVDRLLVFTASRLHFNRLYGGVETSRHLPTVADTQDPGVETVDLTLGDAPGIDFAIESNRTTHMVLMRDGVTHLSTAVYRPARWGAFPVMLYRTPYNKETDNGDGAYVSGDFVMVAQDTRGRFASEGVDRIFHDDGWGQHRDGYDTVEWILDQPWCDGRVATFGGSARGITQYMLTGTDHASYVCGAPVVGSPNLYEHGFFQGGGFRKAMVENWIAGQGSLDYLPVIESHPDYDAYWEVNDLNTRAALVDARLMNIGGWYDIFSQGTIDGFTMLQYGGGPGALGNQKMIIGPWTHGGFGTTQQGQLSYPSNATSYTQYMSSDEWYQYWIHGIDNGILDRPAVLYYTMGDVDDPTAPGNEWRWSDVWPPPAAPVPFYLHRSGRLDETLPTPDEPSDAYSYDPLDPVPTIGGANLTIPAGPYDQSSLESRPDVLVYSTPVLLEPIEVTGRILARLWASSDAPDTDWTVKLTDAYPDGRSMLVLDGILRARHRESMSTEVFMDPGGVYLFEVDVWSTSIVFDRGHRIRIAISSSNDPRFDPNPNTGHPFRADDETQVALNTIHHDATRPSYVLLPVIKDASGGCATATEPGTLLVEKIAGDAIRLAWGATAPDSCFEAWRVHGADDPTDWSHFESHPVAETTAAAFAGDPPFPYYLVTAVGTDGSAGPAGR